MRNRIGILFISLATLFFIGISASRPEEKFEKITENQINFDQLTVEDLLMFFGDKKPIHYIDKLDKDSVKMGYEMVIKGKLSDGSNKRLSKYFVCTDCHNLTKEVENIGNENPTERMIYGKKNNLPFLPGSTFYGMYSKTHWYNEDYALKYGDLVKPTLDTLYNAIQLCAVECSQGRRLDHWEIRAIMHYYKSIQYKFTDLKFNSDELNKLRIYYQNKNEKAIDLIKTKYDTINPATFGKNELEMVENYTPSVENGKYIFDKGCLHCHQLGKGITNFEFDNEKLTFSFLNSSLNKKTPYSVPFIVRVGTYAISGRKQYMPHYTYEKMSKEQLLDLVEYIKTEAKK